MRSVEEYSSEVPIVALVFRDPYEIRLVKAPSSVVSVVRNVCQATEEGFYLGECKTDENCHNFRFDEKFADCHVLDSVLKIKVLKPLLLLRRIALRILFKLYHNGWRLVLSSRMSYRWNVRNWYFRKSSIDKPLPSSVCVSIYDLESVMLIGSDESVFGTLLQTCKDHYARGVLESGSRWEIADEIKLGDWSWLELRSRTVEVIAVHRLILAIVQQLHRHRYRLYATGDVQPNADSMFFVLDPDLQSPDDVFFSISLIADNLMYFIGCGSYVCSIVAETVRRHWPKGLLGEVTERTMAESKDGVWELVLNGCPWNCDRDEAAAGRTLLCKIFEKLLQTGWRLETSLDLCFRSAEKTMFIFKSCPSDYGMYSCLGFFGRGDVRVIHGSGSLADIVRRVSFDRYSFSVSGLDKYREDRTLTFSGSPFADSETVEPASMHMAALHCHWLHELQKAGWSVICSANVSPPLKSGETDSTEANLHSWFLLYTGEQPESDSR